MPSGSTVKHVLTTREKEIVRRLSTGRSMKVIADELGVSPNTIQNQVVAARKKLSATNTVHLVSKALIMKLV